MATSTRSRSKFGSLSELPDGAIKDDSAAESLSELRLQYGYEASRARSIAAKASGLLAFNALVLAFVGNFSDLSFVVRLLIVIFIVPSVFLILLIMLSRTYFRPLAELTDAGSYATMDFTDAAVLLIESYAACIDKNQTVNDRIVFYYELALFATALSIVVITIVSFT